MKTSLEHILFPDKERLIIQHTIVPLSRQEQGEQVWSIFCFMTRRDSLFGTPLCHYQDKSNENKFGAYASISYQEKSKENKCQAMKTSLEHIWFHDKERLIIRHTIIPLSRQEQ